MSFPASNKPEFTLTCESLLQIIAGANPPPWYARVYAQNNPLDRGKLEELLTELRLSGIIQLTDWQKETGQGYRITEYGNTVLGNPAMMERLKGPFEAQPIKLLQEAAEPREVKKTTTFERGELAREALLAPRKWIITNLLIGMNLFVFLLCVAQSIRWEESPMQFLLNGDADVIRRMGGLNADELARGHWIVLFTYAFLHYGLPHLAMNMVSLFLLGRFLETAWGSGRFFAIYSMSVLGGATACMVYNPGTAAATITVAGASGGIWGLMVSYVVWLIFSRRFIPEPVLRSSLQAWFLTLAVNLLISSMPHISFYCHVGGGIIGGLASIFLYLHWHYSPAWKSFAFAALSIMPLVCISLIINEMHTSADWQAIMAAAKKSS